MHLPYHHLHFSRHRRHALYTILILLVPFAYVFILGLVNQETALALARALGLSLYRLIGAYFISLVVAVGLAVSLGQSRFGTALTPIFDVLQNLPSFALIPVFLLWFGYTNLMVIIFAATSILWPILFYCITAIHSARTDLNEAAQLFGARGWRRALYYHLPLAFPAIVTGSIVGLSIGWEAVIGVEIIGLTNGIGHFLNSAPTGGNSNLLLWGIISLLLIVFTLNKLVWLPLLKQAQLYAE